MLRFAYLVIIACCILLVYSNDITDCQYLHVSPDTFVYSGWYAYMDQERKFGSHYFHFIDQPHSIHLLKYQNHWYFHNWEDKDTSYTSSSNIASIPSRTSNDTTWYSMADGSQIELTLTCSQTLNTSSASSTTIPQEEQLYWMIHNQNCHDNPRGYVAFITNSISTSTTSAYWDIPTLSNHTSNVTFSISGNHNAFSLGEHKITYAAESKKYFIMCQITLFIIGDVSQQEIMTQCTELPDGRIGMIEWTVDHDTWLVIDTDKYEYQTAAEQQSIQVQYVTLDLIQSDITCYINIHWGIIGDAIAYSSVQAESASSHDFIGWEVLIVLCVLSILGLIIERVYFYRILHNKSVSKYHAVSNESELSLNIEDMEVPPLPTFDRKRQPNGRSMSVSTGSSYIPVQFTDPNSNVSHRRMYSNNRAMSMQSNSGINRRRQRHMSVPNNLMSENAIKSKREKESAWINDHEDGDFWKKELKLFKEAGFANKKHNLSMLVKYVVKNEQQIVDKNMTQTIVMRILQKERKQNKVNDEMEYFLENEWDNEEQRKDKSHNDKDDQIVKSSELSEVMI